MPDATKYTQKLAGQRALIFGGTSGLGFGAAEALIEHGVEIIISSSNPDKIQKSISKLEASYPSAKGKIQGHACDMSGSDAPANVAAVFDKVGTIDHVLYTAGDPLAIRPLEDWSLSDMQQAGMVRFFGPMLVAQHLKKHLRGGPNSSFTITSGNVAVKPHKDWAVINGYATGQYGLMRGLAFDLAPIRVNVVSPGAVDTELWDPIRKAGNLEAAFKQFRDLTLTGEIAQVEDVVETYLYLMKDKNVTGTVIGSNGGMNLK